MTSEIAVMNQRAVALAADSAVTLVDGRRVVVRNEQKKLHPLADGKPVGIMFFGNADIMGHPWDHLVDHYRETHSGAASEHLSDYGAAFTGMLDNLTSFFNPQRYKDEYRRLFATVCGRVLQLAHQLQQYEGSGDDLAVVRAAVEFIWRDYQMLPDGTPRADLPCFPPGFAASIPKDYGDVIEEMIGYWFAQAGVGAETLQHMRDIAVWCVTKELFIEGATGLVFAGFGTQDRYPALSTWYVSAIVSGIAKRSEIEHSQIDNEVHSAIRLFADSAVTSSFILGIDSNLEQQLYRGLGSLMTSFADDIVEAFPEVDAAKRESVRESFAGAVPGYLGMFQAWLADYQRRAFIDPVLTVLGIATRADLAQTARELVRLNIFKKRIMAQHETVGGEVDVAVISREGGFQWWPAGS